MRDVVKIALCLALMFLSARNALPGVHSQVKATPVVVFSSDTRSLHLSVPAPSLDVEYKVSFIHSVNHDE